MKKILSDFRVSILSKDALKKIKGGDPSFESCGQCIDNNNKVLQCTGTPDTGCCCPDNVDTHLCDIVK